MSNFGEIGATVIELFYVFWGHAGPPSIALSASRDKKNKLVLREIRTRGPLDYKSSALTIELNWSCYRHGAIHAFINRVPTVIRIKLNMSPVWPWPCLPDLVAPFTGPLPEGEMENVPKQRKKLQKVLFLAIFTDGDSSESRPSRKSGPQKCRISERQKSYF